jgi:MFS family permease
LERLAGMILVLGTLLMPVALVDRVPLWVWFVATSVAGLGMGLGYAPLSNVTLAAAEPGREGAASAALQLSDVLGIALGTGVGGAIVSAGNRAGYDPAVALAAVFAMSATVAVVVVLLAGRLRVADAAASGPGQPRSSAVRNSRS